MVGKNIEKPKNQKPKNQKQKQKQNHKLKKID